MKKRILLIPAFLLTGILSFGQSFHFGVKAGADLHKIEGESFKSEFKAGYHVGLFAEIGLPGKIGIHPELYYSQVNPETETASGGVATPNNITKIKLGYLNIPLLLSVKVLPVLSLQLGPQFGILVNKDDNFEQNGKNAFKNGDVGIAGGAQLNLTKVRIYARYVAGLNDIDNANAGKWHNQSIHLGVGLRIF